MAGQRLANCIYVQVSERVCKLVSWFMVTLQHRVLNNYVGRLDKNLTTAASSKQWPAKNLDFFFFTFSLFLATGLFSSACPFLNDEPKP